MLRIREEWQGEIRRDGVDMSFYSDGSGPSLSFIPRGAQYSGVNERLNASNRKRNITTSELAKTLCFKRDVNFCYLPYAVIDGDLGRSFPPQPWAQGILPILHVNRAFAFASGAGPNVFRFDPERASRSEDCVRATVWLIAKGWSDGFVRAPNLDEIGEILSNMGINPRRNLRAILAPWFNPALGGGPKLRVRGEFEIVSPEYPRFDGGILQMISWLAKLDRIFDRVAVIPFSKLRFDPVWHDRLTFQGVDSRGQVLTEQSRVISGSGLLSAILGR